MSDISRMLEAIPELTGPPGPQGPTGADGTTGAPGKTVNMLKKCIIECKVLFETILF